MARHDWILGIFDELVKGAKSVGYDTRPTAGTSERRLVAYCYLE